MTTAKEATAMSHLYLETKITQARMKANDLIDVIDQFIYIAAENGKFSTIIYPLKLNNFIVENEQRAYINQIRENLETNGYLTKFHPNDGSLEIKWPCI